MPKTVQLDPKIADVWRRRAPKWQKEFEKLRAVALGCGLTEGLKWGWPCYMEQAKNIVVIHGFKDYCAILFIKGALLRDPAKVLSKIGAMQAGRQFRFTSVEQVAKQEPIIKAYIQEALGVEKAGLKVPLKTTAECAVPAEFQEKLDTVPGLKAAFEALTPGRQRAYLYHFSNAKQSKTRAQRVQKCLPQILKGKGLDD